MYRMRLIPRIFVCLLLGTSALAQEQTSTVIVPVVGSVLGTSSTRWKTDVEIVNDSGREVDVALELTAAPGAPAIVLSLAPGQVQRFSDIVGEAFGLESALSPLRVITGSRRPVTVKALVYAIRGGEISKPQPIATYLGQLYYPLRALDGLEFSNEFRTNIGLVNYGDTEADFLLALQRVPGRNVAVSHVRVAAGALSHVSVQSIFPLITKGSGFSVVVETNAPETYVYASVIESETNEARFVQPRVGSR